MSQLIWEIISQSSSIYAGSGDAGMLQSDINFIFFIVFEKIKIEGIKIRNNLRKER